MKTKKRAILSSVLTMLLLTVTLYIADAHLGSPLFDISFAFLILSVVPLILFLTDYFYERNNK